MLDNRFKQANLLNAERPLVMGILNVTPDSFSDGGKYTQAAPALAQALNMVEQGADILDIGGESTRPGAAPVSAEDEIARVVPIIQAIRKHSTVAISIDTSKPEVMREAVNAGADIINDVCALQQPGALEAAAELNVPVCLMHMQGQPRTMQLAPSYDSVVKDINQFFVERIDACTRAGINLEQLWLDPGFGFGKSLEHNYTILAKFKEFSVHGLPVLAGLSRKSMLGDVTDKPAEKRISASVAGAIIAAQHGAKIIRVHDVDETIDALNVLIAMQREKMREH